MPLRLSLAERDFTDRFEQLVAAKREAGADVSDAVAQIVADVRARGDAALIALTEKFDRLTLTPQSLRIGKQETQAAFDGLDEQMRKALETAAERIEGFHQLQKPRNERITDTHGIVMGYRFTPIEAVGLYVPGGTASYPSSVLMNAIPARVAGVERLAMTVPAPEGKLNPLVLAAAHLAGIEEIYHVGGAQAIAALAFGTETIAAVDKIVGPGNAYVAEAKRQLFGHVGIDMVAGPSEILVVADAANDPAWTAADLLSQAEHDPVAQAILITDSPGFADHVLKAIEQHLARLDRAEVARQSWADFGAVILVDDLVRQAPPLIDRLAPEHLALAVAEPEAFMDRVRHAGSVFLGRHTPEAVGDYVGGPNHVLPTGRRARFSSGLGVLDFMKRTSFLGLDQRGLAAVGPAAVTLARAEGLDAHALSVTLRLQD
ncbi:MAG: histidinol dehydrogenase [Rhodothalassiaceae bacterium]